MKVNGEVVEVEAGTSLEDVLKNQGFNPEIVVVELNGDVIVKSKFATTFVNADDVAEVLSFVGGG